MLKQGLYEQVVNTEIKDELRQLPEGSKHVEKIDAAESSSVLTQYLSEVVHKGLDRTFDAFWIISWNSFFAFSVP